MVFQESRDSLWFATIVVFLISNGCNNSSPSFVYHFQKWVQTLPMHWLHCWCWQTLTSLGWNSTINTFPVSMATKTARGKHFVSNKVRVTTGRPLYMFPTQTSLDWSWLWFSWSATIVERFDSSQGLTIFSFVAILLQFNFSVSMKSMPLCTPEDNHCLISSKKYQIPTLSTTWYKQKHIKKKYQNSLLFPAGTQVLSQSNSNQKQIWPLYGLLINPANTTF